MTSIPAFDRLCFCFFLLGATFLFFCAQAQEKDAGAGMLDTLTFGDNADEQAHALVADSSTVIKGGLNQSARTLTAGGAVPWESTTMSFTLKVDPSKQNYFTVKLWGSDQGEDCGRLILYANDLEVGYRNQGDYDVLNQCDKDPEAAGRFVYETVPLPSSLTKGKSSLTFKIVALGRIWGYGPTFDQIQKKFVGPTRGIYRIYTHTDGFFIPPKAEPQGTWVEPSVRTDPGEEVIAQSKDIVNQRLTKLLQNPTSPSASGLDDKTRNSLLLLLGHAYKTTWTPAASNPAVLDLILHAGDLIAENINDDAKSSVLLDWSGAGPLGEAIIETWPDLGKRLDQSPEQKKAWSHALRTSVDYWRTHRRSYTNQSMIVDYNIYTANRALSLLEPNGALPDSQTLHYLYQAIGVEPWLGSDILPGSQGENVGDLPNANIEAPFGRHYYLVTNKGLSRELGYVGGYGETILRFVHDMAVMTGDEKIRQQLDKIERARFYFRYPSMDGTGYKCMKLASEIDNRGAHFPLAGASYNAIADHENWWMDVPSLLPDDPLVTGVAQQGITDGQYYAYIAGRLKDSDTLGMMLNVDEYQKVKGLAASTARLPMTEGQPDFVFSDEEDAVLALKHGNTRLFVNFYYRAEAGVNRVARVLELTPELVRIATVRPEVQINASGETYTRPDWIDSIRSAGHPPPGQDIHQAWAGEVMPISKRPSDATQPEYGKWGPFLGKAAFYSLRYGDYLIGLNTTGDQTFTLDVPTESVQAQDLNSGKVLTLSGGVKVGPWSTVVIDLGKHHS